MPRRSRIDAAGALHHVIARGVGRETIFQDDLGGIYILTEAGDQ